jgi:hypothetical protein
VPEKRFVKRSCRRHPLYEHSNSESQLSSPQSRRSCASSPQFSLCRSPSRGRPAGGSVAATSIVRLTHTRAYETAHLLTKPHRCGFSFLFPSKHESSWREVTTKRRKLPVGEWTLNCAVREAPAAVEVDAMNESRGRINCICTFTSNALYRSSVPPMRGSSMSSWI